MDGGLRRIRESFQAGLDAALSDLAPLSRDLEQEQRRIPRLARVTVPAYITEWDTVQFWLLLIPAGAGAAAVAVLIEWARLGGADAVLTKWFMVRGSLVLPILPLWVGMWCWRGGFFSANRSSCATGWSSCPDWRRLWACSTRRAKTWGC